MRLSSCWTLAVAVLAWLAPASPAQKGDPTAEAARDGLHKLEAAWNEAHLRGDAQALHSRDVARAHRHPLRDPRVPNRQHVVGAHDTDEQREALLVGHLLLGLEGAAIRVDGSRRPGEAI